jgi:hypothetical protein
MIEQHIKSVLRETIKILFPLYADTDGLIKRHAWRNKKYLGEHMGKVVAWQGWSANLVAVDFRYRAIFIDVVDNVLPTSERIRLFGDDFANAINHMQQFVVMFVLDFPVGAVGEIKKQGFIPRTMSRSIHACVIAEPHDFILHSPIYWAAQVVKLVILQRFLSIHRKPIDTGEVPLQNLLYRTGYLHSYFVNNGLELHQLSQPRKAGDFGHDFHAVATNTKAGFNMPFTIGIELYLGALGYHLETIPQYINTFRLRGIIIIAKDNPLGSLGEFQEKCHLPLHITSDLSQVGPTTFVALHYLPLDEVISDLAFIRDEIESLIPTLPSQ